MKVLIIDDEDDIRRVAEFSLKRVGGHNTFTASSASHGIQLAQHVLPDVILMDVMMPGMDGIQAFLELRRIAATSRIPVIFMTARVQRAEIEQYLTVGGAGVISKPFDPVGLPQEVKRILAKHEYRF